MERYYRRKRCPKFGAASNPMSFAASKGQPQHGGYADIKERLWRAGGQVKKFAAQNWKVRLILILCGILLIAGITKRITEGIFYQEADIADAFRVTDFGCIESRLQITADYGASFLTEHDKQRLVAYLANALGIRMEGAAAYQEDEISQILTYEKEARQAKTTIKAITLQEDMARTYLYVELVIYDDVTQDILAYRDILLKALEELSVVQTETTLQFLGAYEGQLPDTEWDRIVDSMIRKLDGKIIYENRDVELYTVYAYSALLPEYRSVEKKKINIQAAMRYEKDKNRTVVYLATPLIRGDW